MNLKGDLHIHSNFSDGKFSIQELVDKYSEKEYNVISITDHDTVEGCQEAINYGKTKNILVIPGIEISTKHNGEEVHILGYFNNEDYKKKEILDYSKEKKHSRYMVKNILSKDKKENIFYSSNDGEKLIILEKLLLANKDKQLVFIEDTAKTLLNVEEKFKDIELQHILSFMV